MANTRIQKEFLDDELLNDADIGVTVQAYDAVLDATTASFTTAQETKLGHITVTQAVDLDAIEAASHAAVTVSDSSEIDLTLTGQQISASIVAGSIDETKLDVSVNASLDLADSASQPGHTHTASNITDFDTEVSNNADVAANTSARHAAVTVSGTPDYITLVGQDIVRGQIDLATDVTGDLPFANIAEVATNRIIGRSTAGTGDIESLTGATVRDIIGLDTDDSPQFTAINLGHATDTTITRVSAGVIAVEGVNVSLAGHTHTLANITDVTASAAEVNVLDGIPATLTATELGYVDGVTSAIQTQLDAKLATSAYDDATAGETNTGTSTAKYVSPDGLAGSYAGTKSVVLDVIAAATALTTGDNKYSIIIPSSLNGMDLVAAHARVFTAGTTGTTDIQLHNVTDAVDILSTKITIDSTETTSYTAATPPVINTSNDSLATGDVIRVDVDAISTTAPLGLQIILEARLP